MKQLNPVLVAKVQSAMKGKRLEKFNNSIAILNESLAQEEWVKFGHKKAHSGFYQGLWGYVDFQRTSYSKDANGKAEEAAWHLMMTLSYGRTFCFGHDLNTAIKTLRSSKGRDGEPTKVKATDEQISAWVDLCNEREKAYEFLDEARPKPILTAIQLSPKVTKTLQGMNLDIELPSIKMAKIVAKQRQARDKKGNLMFDGGILGGDPIMETYYVVEWTPGIQHNRSRFVEGCQACGKHIPSGRFVPVEAKDKKSGNLISLWLGCDCADNIFGVKDIGIEK